jgi:hypothetical protein
MRASKNLAVCEWALAKATPPEAGSKVGLALSTIGAQPIHGLRHPPTESTNGWYIWCGNGAISEAPDFFSPLHVEHLAAHLPQVVGYLDLPPGYRFLIDGENYEDVWFDQKLLEVA